MSAEAVKIGMGGRLRDGMASDEWWTPPHVFDALALRFDLDPCAPPAPDAPWLPAATRYSLPEQDGLALPWAGRVWLNPPYGREAQRWVDRLIAHGDGVALVFTRTDARWAQRAMRAADAVCFIRGRLSFIDGRSPVERRGHNAANGSMLLAYGETCAQAVLGCGLGIAYRPHVPAPVETQEGENG